MRRDDDPILFLIRYGTRGIGPVRLDKDEFPAWYDEAELKLRSIPFVARRASCPCSNSPTRRQSGTELS